MCWHLVFGALLAVGARAFAPAPILWGGLSANNYVLVPAPALGAFPDMATAPPQELVIGNQPGKTSFDVMPYFAANPDDTISWNAMGWCLEASGTRSGDVVRFNRCTAEPLQRWSWLPQGSIQLKGTSQCLDGGLSGGPIALNECKNEMTESWRFEEAFPASSQNFSQILALSPFLHYMVVSFSIAVLGAVSLWRLEKHAQAMPVHDGAIPLNIEEGGICLAEPCAMRQCSLPSTGIANVPGVMALCPTSGGADDLETARSDPTVMALGTLPLEETVATGFPNVEGFKQRRFLAPSLSSVRRRIANIGAQRVAAGVLAAVLAIALPRQARKILLVNALSGAFAASLLAPIVQVIDVAVVKVAGSEGKTGILAALGEGCLAWVRSPASQFRNFAFRLVWCVYCLTYIAANNVKSICGWTGMSPMLPSLFFVTGVNMIGSMYKDAAIAKFNKCSEECAVAEENQFPLKSFLLFVVRDVMTIGSGFALPAIVSIFLSAKFGLNTIRALSAAQLICPAAIQFLALPFHFLALDVFNFKTSRLRARLGRLAAAYPKLVPVRAMRGFASLGIGGIGNASCLALLSTMM